MEAKAKSGFIVSRDLQLVSVRARFEPWSVWHSGFQTLPHLTARDALHTVIVTQTYIARSELHAHVQGRCVHTHTFNCMCTATRHHLCTRTHTQSQGRAHTHPQTMHACSKNTFIGETFQLFPGSEDNGIGLTTGENEGRSANRQRPPHPPSSSPPRMLFISSNDTPTHRPLLCLAHPRQSAHSRPSRVLSRSLYLHSVTSTVRVEFVILNPTGSATRRQLGRRGRKRLLAGSVVSQNLVTAPEVQRPPPRRVHQGGARLGLFM